MIRVARIAYAMVAVAAPLFAGACAAAGVSQAAAKAIAHPIRLISTPEAMLRPEAQDCAAGVAPLYRRGFPEPQALAS